MTQLQRRQKAEQTPQQAFVQMADMHVKRYPVSVIRELPAKRSCHSPLT